MPRLIRPASTHEWKIAPAMQPYQTTKMPFRQFALATGIISLLWLVGLLTLYVLGTQGFAGHLLGSGDALARFLRQVITNGLFIVFIINYLSYFLHAFHADQFGIDRIPLTRILLDLPIRIALFMALHALVYVLSADWFGSFGGDRAQALRVVAPTLARSPFFENLSGVYFYAIVFSAIPLYVPALERAAQHLQKRGARHGAQWVKPTATMPNLLRKAFFTVVITLAHAILLASLAAAITRLQTG